MPENSKSSVNWAMVCHLGGLATYIGIPLGNIFVPLVVWLAKRRSNSSLDAQGREAVNFNLSFTIYAILAGLTCYILIGFVLLPAVLIVHIILVIRAALKANKGEDVHYPFSLRFIN